MQLLPQPQPHLLLLQLLHLLLVVKVLLLLQPQLLEKPLLQLLLK